MKIKFANDRVWAVGLALLACFAQPGNARKMKGDDLSNMIIEGENRLTVHPVLPEMDWKADPLRDVTAALKDYSVVGILNPPELEAPPVVLPQKSVSNKTAMPWFNRILEGPILSLALKRAKDDRRVESVFFVKDSAGKVFYDSKTKGELPKELKWDGFGNSGQPLRMGFDYSYSYSVVDEAGNPHRFSGQAFRLDAFRYEKSRNIVMAFFPEALFENNSSFRLSRDGLGYLSEVKDYIRTHFSKFCEVRTFEKDLKFAAARSNAIRNFLLEALDFPEEKLSASALPLKGGEYRRVEILLK